MNDVLRELKISKVKLSKILGVSRQMVYNYLQMDDFNEWPIDKLEKLLSALDLNSIDDLNKLSQSKQQLQKVKDNLIIQEEKFQTHFDDFQNSGVLNELVLALKTKLLEDSISNREVVICYNYLTNYINSLDEFDEFKYILEYFAKIKGMVNPRVFSFDKDEQIIFEGIMYQAMSLYHNGGASRSKVIESHEKMIKEIEFKKEEKLSRTQELYSVKEKALRELGYKEINETNASEVFEKMVEIENRKIN